MAEVSRRACRARSRCPWRSPRLVPSATYALTPMGNSLSGCPATPPPSPLPETERGSEDSFFSPSPLRGGGRGEGFQTPSQRPPCLVHHARHFSTALSRSSLSAPFLGP